MKAKDLLKILESRPKNLPVYIECCWKLNGIETRGYVPLQSITATNKGHMIESGTRQDRVLCVGNVVDYLKCSILNLKMCTTSLSFYSKPTISYPEIDFKATLSSIKKVRGSGYYVRNPKGKNKVLLLTEK